MPELLLPVALTVAVPRVVRAATKVPVVAQQTYAHQHQSTIALSLPEAAAEPEDSLVVPVVRLACTTLWLDGEELEAATLTLAFDGTNFYEVSRSVN